jgi:hypothetical protein
MFDSIELRLRVDALLIGCFIDSKTTVTIVSIMGS